MKKHRKPDEKGATGAGISNPRPAATVALARETNSDIEVLLLLRNTNLAFNGGHWVFPGGKIDPEDYAGDDRKHEYPAACRAAVRETYEEAGIIIDSGALIHTAHWTTPPQLPIRYCTWFFLYPLYNLVDVIIDNSEIHDYCWITPSDALASFDQGRLKLPRPTQSTLSDLSPFRSLDALLAGVSNRPVRVYPQNSRYYRPVEMGLPGVPE